MSTNEQPVASARSNGIKARLRNRLKRSAEPSLELLEARLARRIIDTVRQELAETREELHADLATLVELTVELERIASRLEASGARDPG
jgi:hypothetical protein